MINHMTKRISIVGDNLSKAKDKKYVFITYEHIISSLMDFPNVVTKLWFEKTKDTFLVSFNLKVCQTGDLVWILCKEFLNTILETESNIDLMIDEIEEDGTGTTYKLYRHIS